jgi:hypothetical protein
MRYLRLPPRLNWNFSSSGLLRGVSWLKTDVSGPSVGDIFSGQAVLGEFDHWRWDYVVLKRRCSENERIQRHGSFCSWVSIVHHHHHLERLEALPNSPLYDFITGFIQLQEMTSPDLGMLPLKPHPAFWQQATSVMIFRHSFCRHIYSIQSRYVRVPNVTFVHYILWRVL